MKRRSAVFLITAVLNIVLIICVIGSVVYALEDAESASFSQNIKNVRTLTDAAASKIELEIFHHTQEIKAVSDYINNYNGVGMTLNELRDYFNAYYANETNASWQLIDSRLNNENISVIGFDADVLTSAGTESFYYGAKSYEELAKLFLLPAESTLGQIYYTSEFTDPSPALAKSFALTAPIRIRAQDAEYEYKTLMLLLKSTHLNELITSNNDIDTLSYYDYSGVIIDDNGNYVISSASFQGTNFTDFIALYNDDFTSADASALRKKLHGEDYSDVLYYLNNKGQRCAYTIVPVQNSTWHILSVVTIESFRSSGNNGVNCIRFFLFFATLFAVDMAFALWLNTQLRRKKREAEAASDAKSQFLSSMSHDIRTPMNAIIGMTVIAKENLEEETPDRETLKDCVKTIELSGNHLLTLINDILDISKIESGKVALSPDDFSISEATGKMLEIIQPQIKEKNFDFETHIINVSHEFVHADELRINQIYINILTNAIKYTNAGGKITVDLCEEPIQGRTDAARFIYRVSDNGIGMDEEFQKTMFERFTRAVDTRINTVQGTGLGMSIVKQLVDLMGGTITVSSKLNVGSTFTVTLDLPVADIRVERISLENLTALLIDDDPILLETAEHALTKAGMRVDTASDGNTGVSMALRAKLINEPYSVILVDWKMAEMSGLEVIKALREKLDSTEKIIVMTAYNIADIERKARDAGADGFISKPLFRSKLLHAIQSIFSETDEAKSPSAPLRFDLDVLVAEDNMVNWKVLKRLLARYGIEPDRAENGKTALEKVRDGGKLYDLILMDIQMPIMDGYAATEAIRALDDKRRAATPIYAMTADTFAEDVSRCLEKGMNGHLAKPIEIDRLTKVLALLSEKKEKAQND
ncbi:MAG: response regulator [Eubacteriales bacterium]|nr:response regulator [Eubacteriales bacterium]MDD3883266.1 response regulator [Eubacteriales bacterium]MDD4513851.1 response regulator [Eubacteriales bacterium]